MPTAPPVTRLMVLLFTDVVDSVGLKTRVGTSVYAGLLSRHDDIFRSIVGEYPGGEILKDMGDGFLAHFRSTSEAISAALRFQYRLAREEWEGEPILIRVGIHLGEMTELEKDIDGKHKIVGLAADMSARIMGLALPGQTLLTRAAFDDGRQYVREHPTVESGEELELRWMAHGPYLFQGNEDALEVYEVGAAGIAPLREPPNSQKARRSVPAGEEEMWGWRPGVGLALPRMPGWVLDRKLGEGGFGEVWLARQNKTSSLRVFKFCFDADRLRSFKRELTLFRLLHESLGDRPDIARIHDIQLEHPPFFLESEFTDKGDLKAYAEHQGGIDKVPLKTRLDLVIRTCDAVAAAHSIGVLHKDIKPANILIYEAPDGEPRPRLSDFGIGALTAEALLASHDITMTGFTDASLLSGNESSRSGTRLYSPPESMIGGAFTVQGDVYAIGVMLYQMVVGDLQRPLYQGWERDVADPMLREDIARCTAGKLEDRASSAAEIAASLRTLGERKKAALRRKLTRLTGAASIVLTILLGLAAGLAMRERGLRKKIEVERDRARQLADFMENMLGSVDPAIAQGQRKGLLVNVLDDAALRIEIELAGQPELESAMRHTIGSAYRATGEWDAAEQQLVPALEIRREILGNEDRLTLETLNELAGLYCVQSRYDVAEPLALEALELRRTHLGEDDRDTLESRNDLGLLYTRAGRFEEAETAAQRAYDDRLRVLGEEDPDTLESMRDLAGLFIAQARYEDAEPLLTRAMSVSKRVLGKDNPDTLTAMNELGKMLFGQGRFPEAEALYLETLERRRRILGNDHPGTLESVNNLAMNFLYSGNFDEALPLLEESYELCKEVLGAEHESTQVAMSNLAEVYQMEGRISDAIALLEGALETSRRALKNEHPTTLTLMHNLATVYAGQKRFEEGERLHLESRDGRAEHLGPGHEDTLNSLNSISSMYLAPPLRLDQAEEACRASLESHREHEGDDVSSAHAMFNMALVHVHRERYNEAEELFEEALVIYKRDRGDKHRSTQVTLKKIAEVRERL